MNPDGKTGMRLNRRQALALSAAAGAGLAFAKNSHASDSTKTGAHLDPGYCSTPRSAIANTQYGKVRGFLSGGVFTFKGIPYGQDTGGENRWLPAKSPVPWKDEYPALIYGANCPQNLHPWTAIEQTFLQDWDDGYQSEDMLKLNVWTPSLTGKRAVLVYFHGGGYSFGSAYELPSQEGAQMARLHDVVSVTVNHRLNILGFLDVSEIGGSAYEDSVNVGMTDLVASLKWVQENIANFGGDPDRVMIYGQSGGGSKVTTLMGMPSAAGLFHRASVQSGGGGNIPAKEQQREVARQMMKELGLEPHDLASLQKMEWAKLVAAGNAAISKINPPMRGASGPLVANLRRQDRQCSVLLRRCAGGVEEHTNVARLGERRRQPDAQPPQRRGVARQPRQGLRRRQGGCPCGRIEEGASGKEHSHVVVHVQRHFYVEQPLHAEQHCENGPVKVRAESCAGLRILLHVAIADAGRRRRMAHRRTPILLRQHQALRTGHGQYAGSAGAGKKDGRRVGELRQGRESQPARIDLDAH
jgi:hypothetical protein